MKKNNKGFTLAELLIVVAIIAVLVAVAIPIFNTQLEKARESTDLANARDFYAEIAVALVDGSLSATTNTMTVSGGLTATATYDANGVLQKVVVANTTVNQKQFSKWQSGTVDVAGITVPDANAPTAATDKNVTFTFSDGSHLSAVKWGA